GARGGCEQCRPACAPRNPPDGGTLRAPGRNGAWEHLVVSANRNRQPLTATHLTSGSRRARTSRTTAPGARAASRSRRPPPAAHRRRPVPPSDPRHQLRQRVRGRPPPLRDEDDPLSIAADLQRGPFAQCAGPCDVGRDTNCEAVAPFPHSPAHRPHPVSTLDIRTPPVVTQASPLPPFEPPRGNGVPCCLRS